MMMLPAPRPSPGSFPQFPGSSPGSFPSRITSQGEEIITRPFFRRRGGFWIQDFVITPEALEQGGSAMSKIA